MLVAGLDSKGDLMIATTHIFDNNQLEGHGPLSGQQ